MFHELPIEKKRIIIKIGEAKQKLRDTDYVTDKLVTALVDYILTGDKSKLLSLYVEYKSMLDDREECRKRINELERLLNE